MVGGAQRLGDREERENCLLMMILTMQKKKRQNNYVNYTRIILLFSSSTFSLSLTNRCNLFIKARQDKKGRITAAGSLFQTLVCKIIWIKGARRRRGTEKMEIVCSSEEWVLSLDFLLKPVPITLRPPFLHLLEFKSNDNVLSCCSWLTRRHPI